MARRSWWLGNRRLAGAGEFRLAPIHRSEFSNRLFLGGLLPSRARLRFTSHRQ